MTPDSIPVIDDRTYRDLVDEGLRIVGNGDGEWTNRNPSDPGITLLELLAYVTELFVYRVGRLRDEDLRAFARLLSPSIGSGTAAEQLSAAVRQARHRERVVTSSDFEREARAADARVAAAHCTAERDLTSSFPAARRAVRPGHVTVLIVPDSSLSRAEGQMLCQVVQQHLEPRRLVTTRVHVGIPQPVEVRVQLAIELAPNVSRSTAMEGVNGALEAFFHPVTGGGDGRGWSPGRALHVPLLYRTLARLPGLAFVGRMRDRATGAELDEVVGNAQSVRTPDGNLVSVAVDQHEVIRASPDGHVLDVRVAGQDAGA